MLCVCVCVGWNIISSSWNWYKWLKMAKIVQNFVWNGMMRGSEREMETRFIEFKGSSSHTFLFRCVQFRFGFWCCSHFIAIAYIFSFLSVISERMPRVRERDGAYFDSTTCTQWAIQYIGNKIKYWWCTLLQVPNVLLVGRGRHRDVECEADCATYRESAGWKVQCPR